MRPNVPQPIVYFEIVGRDADLLRSYYGQLFGWQFDASSSPRGFEYASVRTQETCIDGAVGSAPPGTDGYVTFYVAVADVETTLKQALRLGGSRLFGPYRITETFELGMLADPEGHLIGVACDRTWPSTSEVLAHHLDPRRRQ
jgi:predicted enzyme related to lactoylglutathione lyase